MQKEIVRESYLKVFEFLERYPPEGDIRTEQRFDRYVRYGGMPIIDLDDPPHKNRAIRKESMIPQ